MKKKLKLQFPIIAEFYQCKILNNKTPLSGELILYFIDFILNLLQIACSLKLPPNYLEHKIALFENSLVDLKGMAKETNTSISDLDETAPITEQYNFLMKKLGQRIEIKAIDMNAMLADEDQWDTKIILLINMIADTLERQCIDFWGNIYHKAAREFLMAIYDRFLLLKRFCNFKARTYYLYPLFSLDILVNILFKDFEQSDSSWLGDERKIMVYMDRYQKNAIISYKKQILANMAMLKIDIIKNDLELMQLHFVQFKENYLNNFEKIGNLRNLIFQVLPKIIEKICEAYNNAEKFQNAVNIIIEFRKIINTTFDKHIKDVNAAHRTAFEKQKLKIEEYCRKILTVALPKITNMQANQSNNENDSTKNQIPNTNLPLEKNDKESLREEIREITDVNKFEKLAKVEEKSTSANNSQVIYSKNYFLWSSLNKKLKLNAKLAMQSCIDAKMTKEEIDAAVIILEAERITGAIGDGIKLVSKNEQEQSNLERYVYKIKHVRLNFRIYGRFDYNNGKKELIFDYPVRGHKNNSKNTPKNVAISDISSSPAKSRR